jgi:hypothetical protein
MGSSILIWFKFWLQKRVNLVFAIVPLLLFIFMLFRLAEIHFFYQSWHDPVYAYLLNGLTFALGSNDIGHTDHPGTPLQLFCALVIKLLGMLRGTDNIANDVLTYPESYIRVISLSLIAINCLLLWILGIFAFKNLKNLNLSIVLQLMPLLSFQLLNFMPIVACESLVVFSSLAIAASIILWDDVIQGRKWLFIFIVLFSALAISTKISSLVILIVPFFFFEKFKTKAGFLIFSILLIILFISPVIDKMGNFFNFIKGISTHTGIYGSGEAKMIDWAIFIHSIEKMLLKELSFTFHLLLLPLGWIVIVKHKISGSLKRLYLAITLATIFQVLVVARHYSFHYFMPVFALVMPLHGYFWIRFFQQKIGTVSTRIASLVTIVLVIGVFTRLIIKNQFEKGITNPVEQTSRFIRSEFKGTYIILSDYYNGSAFIEPALRFGCGYSGSNIRKRYMCLLDSIYPGNYIWNNREGFTDWSGSYLPSELFSKYNEIYLYGSDVTCVASAKKISDMIVQSGMGEFVRLKNVYTNHKTGEVIDLAHIDTALVRQYSRPVLYIESGIEEITTDGESLKTNIEEYTFKGGKLQSHKFARDGKFSLLLTPANPFGLNITITVSKGKRFKVEFWQRSSAQKQALVVASASKGDIFYRTSNKADNIPGEWYKSQLALSLPDDYPEETINFYLWNPEVDSVWVDDLSIAVYP